MRIKNALIQVMGGNHYKNNPMMGDYAKKEFGNRLYTIGFIAYQGDYAMNYNRKIKPVQENSLEYIIGQSKYDDCFLPLNDLKIAPYHSRPLGNFYMTNDIANVMDGVIFNRNMKSPKFDKNLYLDAYPENKYLKRDTEE